MMCRQRCFSAFVFITTGMTAVGTIWIFSCSLPSHLCFVVEGTSLTLISSHDLKTGMSEGLRVWDPSGTGEVRHLCLPLQGSGTTVEEGGQKECKSWRKVECCKMPFSKQNSRHLYEISLPAFSHTPVSSPNKLTGSPG